jgi:hypothetical protein
LRERRGKLTTGIFTTEITETTERITRISILLS